MSSVSLSSFLAECWAMGVESTSSATSASGAVSRSASDPAKCLERYGLVEEVEPVSWRLRVDAERML